MKFWPCVLAMFGFCPALTQGNYEDLLTVIERLVARARKETGIR